MQSEVLDKIEVKDFLPKPISVEEFISIFEQRFNGFPIHILYENGSIIDGTSYEKAEVYLFNNIIQFYEEDGEVAFRFEIKMDGIERIEIDDYWPIQIPENRDIDNGANFKFFANDGFIIEIMADK